MTDRSAGAGRGTTAHRWVAAGAGGVAAVGIGVLLSTQTGAPAAPVRAVELASFDALLVPQAPVSDELWWLVPGAPGSQRTSSGSDSRSAVVPMIGEGGWLVGNGIDAAADCAAAACNGGNGGLLRGSGGDGANGGRGGNAG
ncbi:MAG: hypothetical protein WBB57_17970, partial [Mycobacterium sp.]